MADRHKSVKTRQVMNLIADSSPADANPFLFGIPKETREEKEDAELTVEEKLKKYTDSKRGTNQKPAKKPQSEGPLHNPKLHIPEEKEEPKQQMPAILTPPEPKPDPTITIDINKIILDENLEKALKRFNTCSCPTCMEKIGELVLKAVPVKIVTIRESEREKTIDKYRDYVAKEISDTIVKTILMNKRKPFHD